MTSSSRIYFCHILAENDDDTSATNTVFWARTNLECQDNFCGQNVNLICGCYRSDSLNCNAFGSIIRLMVRKSLKQGIKACDLFSQPATFRYGDEPQYESLTGGIVSIILFALFAGIFMNTVIETFNKSNISAKITSVQEEDPSEYVVGTDTFMFAIGITGLDLNQGDRWFEIYMDQRDSISGVKHKTSITLQKCQKYQWTRIKPEMGATYDRIGFDKWLCPPDNLTIYLQGKYSSDVFKFYKFGVRKCNDTSPLSAIRPCVNSTTIQDFLNANEAFTFNFYYINTIINPKSKVYRQNYLDDLNYFPFTPTDGVEANFFLSAYEITTDESIYPYEQLRTETGGISQSVSQTINFKVRQKDYLKFYIRKSSLSISIQRSFQKADETLSYIGGLFSAIISVLFIMNKYNELSYEMEIAKNLYHFDKNVPLKSDQFNFFVFLGYIIYAFFETICIKLPWKRMEVYFRSLEQVRKQMDIRLVMKKILYSERMAIAVFDEPKAMILHMQEPLTLQQAENIRKDHRFYDKLEDKYFDYQKIRKQEEQEQRQLREEQDLVSINDQTKKSFGSQKKNPGLSFDQILLSEIGKKQPRQRQRRAIVKRKTTRINTKKLLWQTYKKKKLKQTQKKQKNKVLNILNLFIDQEEQKQHEINCMIDEMKQYVGILQKQAEEGDIISERILDKFDPKLMKMFVLNDERQEEPSSPMKNSQNVSIQHFTINLGGQGSSQDVGTNKNINEPFG